MRAGGLLVVPAAPALKDLETKASYREALVNADMAITDSAYMVMVWNRLQGDSIRRLSGLEYLRELLKQPDVRRAGNVLWVMAGPTSAERNLGVAARGRELRCRRIVFTWRRCIRRMILRIRGCWSGSSGFGRSM